MRTTIISICFMLLQHYCIAQSNNTVSIELEVDGKPLAYKNLEAKFIYNEDTMLADVKDGKLIIPTSIFRKNATVIFCIDKYVLRFDSIPLSVNDLYPTWKLGIDKKPFDKKKFRTVNSWRRVQIVYYLDNNYGRMFTVDGYKKSKVIMK